MLAHRGLRQFKALIRAIYCYWLFGSVFTTFQIEPGFGLKALHLTRIDTPHLVCKIWMNAKPSLSSFVKLALLLGPSLL